MPFVSAAERRPQAAMTQLLPDKLGCEFSSKIQTSLPLDACLSMATPPPSHLLSDVSTPLSHRGTSGCKWLWSSPAGWAECRWQCDSAANRCHHGRAEKKHKGSLSTRKYDGLLFMVSVVCCWSGVNCHTFQTSRSK